MPAFRKRLEKCVENERRHVPAAPPAGGGGEASGAAVAAAEAEGPERAPAPGADGGDDAEMKNENATQDLGEAPVIEMDTQQPVEAKRRRIGALTISAPRRASGM